MGRFFGVGVTVIPRCHHDPACLSSRQAFSLTLLPPANSNANAHTRAHAHAHAKMDTHNPVYNTVAEFLLGEVPGGDIEQQQPNDDPTVQAAVQALRAEGVTTAEAVEQLVARAEKLETQAFWMKVVFTDSLPFLIATASAHLLDNVFVKAATTTLLGALLLVIFEECTKGLKANLTLPATADLGSADSDVPLIGVIVMLVLHAASLILHGKLPAAVDWLDTFALVAGPLLQGRTSLEQLRKMRTRVQGNNHTNDGSDRDGRVLQL